MKSSFSDKLSPILMIIFGIIALAFPLVSTEAIGFVSGIAVMLIAIAFLVLGISELTKGDSFGIIYIILAILYGILAYYLIFSPAFVAGLMGLLVYLFGITLIVLGTIWFITGPIRILSLFTILYGFLTLIVAYFLKDPKLLGITIGLWLIITGITTLVYRDN